MNCCSEKKIVKNVMKCNNVFRDKLNNDCFENVFDRFFIQFQNEQLQIVVENDFVKHKTNNNKSNLFVRLFQNVFYDDLIF